MARIVENSTASVGSVHAQLSIESISSCAPKDSLLVRYMRGEKFEVTAICNKEELRGIRTFILDYKKYVIEFLKLAKKGEVEDRNLGLCEAMYEYVYGCLRSREKSHICCSITGDFVGLTSLTWPGFSGDDLYPVPALEEDESEYMAFTFAEDKYEGEYGESRRNLAEYMLKALEAI